jgi:hypothetical protein
VLRGVTRKRTRGGRDAIKLFNKNLHKFDKVTLA